MTEGIQAKDNKYVFMYNMWKKYIGIQLYSIIIAVRAKKEEKQPVQQ